MANPDSLEVGPFLCIKGSNRGRIGYCDDIDMDCSMCAQPCCIHDCDLDTDCEDCNRKALGKCQQFAFVYWGNMLCCPTYDIIPAEFCTSSIPMAALVQRIQKMEHQTARTKESAKKARLQQELDYTRTIMYERHITAKFLSKEGMKVFISYSSKDRADANCLFADLSDAGHDPWMDEWSIRAGEQIPEKIQEALSIANRIIVLLSPESVESEWVKAEWQALYWEEMQKREIKVIPALIRDCEIPLFLKTKKYADFGLIIIKD